MFRCREAAEAPAWAICPQTAQDSPFLHLHLARYTKFQSEGFELVLVPAADTGRHTWLFSSCFGVPRESEPF